MPPPEAGPEDMQGFDPYATQEGGPDLNYSPESADPYGSQGPYPQGDMGSYPPQGYGQPPSPYDTSPQYSEPYQDDIKQRVEEIAEAIIDEKWNELIKDINKVVEWKERTDTEIKRLGQEIINLKERFESLHKGVLGKITEYDNNLSNVGSDIKAMEMTFQKIMPTFTENINKLDRLMRSSK